ncbi:54S ribosomal protein L23, mitochondrial [Smittium culicis]|uniref:Large ribosomal subunit protein uL23m n=1 Tax=Smittium culicis TaxID=133412 RepID=A0A1R1YQE3_9FUNG|nr:54S ribosomal protein L23, mitochondrial [Smittium culicis]
MSTINKVLGTKKVYFPNLILTLVRDSKLAPNQAAFKVPLHVNKFDIKDYLTNLYKVNVTDVRTVVLPGRPKLDVRSGLKVLDKRTKKAIVTLSEDFNYPEAPDMSKFGEMQSKFTQIKFKNRLHGWRIRKTKAESEIYNKAMESMREE